MEDNRRDCLVDLTGGVDEEKEGRADRTVREILFKDFTGCSNHDCIIKKPIGMGTNGSCGCLHHLTRSELHILKSRLSTIIDKEIT